MTATRPIGIVGVAYGDLPLDEMARRSADLGFDHLDAGIHLLDALDDDAIGALAVPIADPSWPPDPPFPFVTRLFSGKKWQCFQRPFYCAWGCFYETLLGSPFTRFTLNMPQQFSLPAYPPLG